METRNQQVYATFSNEELVKLARGGDEQARAELSARFLNTKGAGISVLYLDSDDFVQEGMIGFLRAVDTYDFSKGVPFEAYAFRCMQNSIKTAAGISKKEIPMGGAQDFAEEADVKEDPLRQIIAGEHFSEVLNACELCLSDIQKTIVFLRAGGMSYEEIGDKLGISPKTVDNALQRARRKLRKVLSD